ncbi:manganese-dependent inorganic pyrophosphatase [Candidatus Campbellbacteria bacterium RIFOXYC2_FULL_35_25]|uniref:inorganic diphosphatase n=1 Tax=Candidatus Campbellbacteria bacterium RIFOXYC2_FULL_35_25 TaxID=1797582 RepID=A0A1F5EIV5_9BACT|nr:MAG: manganese-dependent inorganic pyrophosphatase [Candidatus Campbellbacteria bacterium RIFOXYC2_FULL_35_25]
MKYIIGHTNPDTDTICSAIVYQDFLSQKGVESKALSLGHLNNETKFIFEKFGITAPDHVHELPHGSEIILLDHNEEKQSIKNINDLDIVEIIDHHKVKIETDKPISILVKPLGSSCSIIAEKYFEKLGVGHPTLLKTNAILLIAGILSDTLFFRSPTTTQTDKDLVEKLNEIAQIEDLEKFSLEMFNAKSDLGEMPIEEVIKLDYKVFDFGGKNYGIGVMETTHKDYGINRKEEIVAKMKEIKEKDALAGIFFSIIDILNEENYTITPGEEESALFTKIFNAENQNGILFVDNLISRKKQIVPKFEEYFKN